MKSLKEGEMDESVAKNADENSIEHAIVDLLLLMQKHLMAFVYIKEPENEVCFIIYSVNTHKSHK